MQESPEKLLMKEMPKADDKRLIELYEKTDKNFSEFNTKGYNAFQLGVGNLRHGFVEYVLSKADANQRKKLMNNCAQNGLTPLHMLGTTGLTDVEGIKKMAALLIKYGADMNKLSADGKENTPLHHAMILGRTTLSIFLAENDANVTQFNKEGLAPIHLLKHLDTLTSGNDPKSNDKFYSF